jgi:riboflavin synthase
MFTGIVENTGEVIKAERTDDGVRLWVRSEALRDCEVGASVALSGTCVTVTERDGAVCSFDVMPESDARSTLASKTAGDTVNIERPLKAGSELGGHIVQGHVDAVGTVTSAHNDETGVRLRVQIPRELSRYLIEKGSVTIDGCSLTITSVSDEGFEVALIPHTLAVTTLGALETNDKVNIEVDVLAKYVERLLVRADPKAQ